MYFDCIYIRPKYYRMKFALTVFGMLVLWQVSAQSPAFNQFTTQEGLSGNTVYCGVQDKKGFLWFGTDNGLSRFDGSRFEQFGVKDGLPDPEVLDLFSDSQGDLWISCFKENVCRRKNGVIQSAANSAEMANISLKTSIVTVFEDELKQIWISGKAYSAFQVQGDSVYKKIFPNYVSTVFQLGGEWFAICPEGILNLDRNGAVLKTIPVTSPYPYPFKVFYNCVVAEDKLLVASPHVMLFQREGDTFRLIQENKDLSGKLFKDSKGQFWLASPLNGAICFKSGLKSLHEYQQYLPGKRINAVIEDNQGGFWFGTIGEGVFRLSPHGASVYPLSKEPIQVNVTALGTTPEGGILAADDRGAVYRVGAKTISGQTLPVAEKYNKSRAILRSPPNTCWIGSDKGLFKQENGQLQQCTKLAAIKALVARHDTLWIGTASSIYMLPPHSDKETNLFTERVTALCIDREGWIWSGGTKGLKCERQQFKYYWSERFPELKHKIIALGTGQAGYIWAATPQDGLLRIAVSGGEVQRVEHMSQHFKGALKNIQSIFCEPSGRIWLATNQGIYALQTDLQTQYFGVRDGLSHQDVNCVLVERDTLWAGTVSGITSIPLLATNQAVAVPILFSELRYRAGKDQFLLNLLDTDAPACTIPHDAALVELAFSMQDFNGYYEEDFQCAILRKMPPLYAATFDNVYQWVKNGFQAVADTGFAEKGVLQFGLSLPPGKYLIQAVGRSKTGNQTTESRWLLLEKKAAWYETLLFWLLAWSLVGWVALKIYRDRSLYRKMRMQVAELRVQALQAQINPHFIGNSINAIQQFFYPPDAARASKYIAIFTRLLRKTMEFTDQHFIPLKDELQYSEDYLQLAQLRYEDRFTYKIECDPTILENTPFPGMLLQPLLENATIHGFAPGQELFVLLSFSIENNRLLCRITDNGPGIHHTRKTRHPQGPEHQSRGLDLLKKKIHTLNILYQTDISMTISDRSETTPDEQGTLVEIAFITNPNCKL